MDIKKTNDESIVELCKKISSLYLEQCIINYNYLVCTRYNEYSNNDKTGSHSLINASHQLVTFV